MVAALVIILGVAIRVVQRRGRIGDAGDLILSVGRARLGGAVIGEAGPVAQRIQIPGLGMAAAGERRQPVEVVVAVLFVEAGVQTIVTRQDIAILVIGVLEIIGVRDRVRARIDPALFHHPTEPVETRVLIAAI